tara:strand:- start:2692 stop:4395 length:1704 start_codon:yes stop_codon:yes gene_type:complete
MKKILFYTILFNFYFLKSQTINLNEGHIIDYLRTSQQIGTFKSDLSFNLRPIHIGKNGIKINDSLFNSNEFSPKLITFSKGKGSVKVLPIDYNINYSSHHPYNRNNGSMIPSRGYQHIISAGVFLELGPVSLQIKPEQVFSQNLNYDGFWGGHYDEIWAKKYSLWNNIDIPERFGEKSYKKFLIGQSSLRFNFKGLSFGVSNENIWWGPSKRNSIMMSNHATGFKHFTFNTLKPFSTILGNFEWQFITGRLENSGFTPPNIERTYGGTLLYVPKENEIRENDWRFIQALNISYSPRWIKGLHLGYIRYLQMYSAVYEGRYSWMKGNVGILPIFSNLFRKSDPFENIEEQIDQGAGIYFRWLWEDSNAEVYAEYYYDDSKQNLRDLLLDSDNARATTFGISKAFINSKNKIFQFSWEWTQMEQSGNRLLRGGGSWYRHAFVKHGYTNNGEVLGASIGPGSNSHFLSLKKLNRKNIMELALEIVEQNNDFYYFAFESAKDFRRYWKDYNLHLKFDKKFNNVWGSINFLYSRSLNYQWELEDNATPYYHPGRDVNNFHANIKLVYQIPIN